jgi:predicted transposase/invertase (TIGR01784 family)
LVFSGLSFAEVVVRGMPKIRPLSEQTLMNDYVFSMVMRKPKRIKPLLEYILGKKIKAIEVIDRQKFMKEGFESKGVRLDLYVEDTDGVIYDVDVQTTDKRNLPRRMRYYQAMLDVTFFPTGTDYTRIRKSYVIFICNYDPFGKDRYIYTFQNRCDEDNSILFGDDEVKVVVNTKGTKGEVSPELKEAITYLDSGEVTGPYSKELDDAVRELKSDEERGQEFMRYSIHEMEQRVVGRHAG